MRFAKELTKSKLWWVGSGTKSGSKMYREDLLSQATVTEPEVTWWRRHMALVTETIPINPANSHLYESPSSMGPGTMFTPTKRLADVVPSIT
jgi:hypothetical protein